MQGPLRNIWQNEFFRNVATLLSGTTIAQAVSVLIYIFLAKIYGDEEFGLFGIFMNILNITMIFATGKYELAILLPKSDRDAVNVLGLSALISLGVGGILLVLVSILNEQVCTWFDSEAIGPWLWLIPLSTILVGLFQSFRNYSNRQKRYQLIAGANISQSLVNSGLKLGLGLLLAGAAGLIIGAVAGQVVGLTLFLAVHLYFNKDQFRQISLKGMKAMAREYSLFPRYNMWQGLINNFSGALPVFVLARYFGVEYAGIYTFGYMVLYRPVNLVAGAFYQVMYQRFVEKQQKGLSILKETWFFVRRTALVLLLPFVVFAIFAPDLFGIIFSPDKMEAGRYAQILTPWIFMVALVMPLSFVPDLYKKQRGAMILDGIRMLARLAALAVGVVTENIYLALALVSGISALTIAYSLGWYISLIRRNEQSG